MYNNMQYNPYSYPQNMNMYQQNYQQANNMQQQMPNQSYQNNNTFQNEDIEILKVDGIDGAYQCTLPAHVKSTIALDLHKPLAYVITVSGINRQVTPYNISEYKDPKEEMKSRESDILEAINKINNRLDVVEGKLNESSNKGSKQQQSNGKR